MIMLLLVTLSTVIEGVTFAKLWEWFIADTFDIVAVSTAQMVGIATLVQGLTFQYIPDRDAFELFAYHLVMTGISFGVGCVAVQYV